MEEISKRLNEALELRKMKPSELSEATGIDKGSISLYLSGKYNPKSKKVYKMSEVLKINPTWLLGYDVPMEINKNIPKNEYDKQVEDFAVQLGGQIIHIDKNAPLTAEDVIQLNKVLLEIVEEQNKKDMQKH